MTALEFFIAFGQILSVALIPLIVWFLGVKYQNRKAKKDAQLNLFLTIMAHRKSAPPAKEKVDALNTIDVVFQDNQKVRQAWREYLDSLNSASPHFNDNNSFLLDLLSEMAHAVGYSKLKQTEIDRFYIPQHFSDQLEIQSALARELIRVLERSKSCSDSFSEEEFKQRQK